MLKLYEGVMKMAGEKIKITDPRGQELAKRSEMYSMRKLCPKAGVDYSRFVQWKAGRNSIYWEEYVKLNKCMNDS